MDNQLYFDLTKILYQPDKNLVVSPFSVHTALSMLLPGADGISRNELLNLLFNINPGVDDDPNQITKKLMDDFTKNLKEFLKANQSVLNNANMLYSSNRFQMKKEYVDILTEQFKAVAKVLDFTDTIKSTQEINNDVNNATKGLISKLLDSVDPMTRLILVNAIYFKGIWKYPFDKELVKDGPFKLSNGDSIQTKMMFIEKKFPYGHMPELQASALSLSYSSGSISMVILLPDRESCVKNLMEKLNNENLKQIFQKMECFTPIRLTLPKFKIESTHELCPHFNRLGLQSVFDHRASFPGISKEPLFISEIIQKAVIEVNEEGTEAAAATAIMMMRCAMPLPPQEFKVDRPFIFLLLSNDKKHVLFTGVVENPN